MKIADLHINTLKAIVIAAALIGAILFPLKVSYSSFIMQDPAKKIAFFKPVIDSLLKNGADTAFVYSLVTDTKTQFNDRFVKINVLNYMRELDLTENYNPYSVKMARKFLDDNRKLLKDVEKYYGTPREVVASILWVETKYGRIMGESHIPSVFLSTAMAIKPEFYLMNKEALEAQLRSDTTRFEEFEKKLAARTARKASWAIKELLALEKINKYSSIDIKNLYGSWAGAFGLSQFLPSSYLSWAVDGNCNGKTNLFELHDAAYSIGNYLKSNGWGPNQEAQRKAIYHYNNNDNYVDAVMKLASKIKYRPYKKTDMEKKGIWEDYITR